MYPAPLVKNQFHYQSIRSLNQINGTHQIQQIIPNTKLPKKRPANSFITRFPEQSKSEVIPAKRSTLLTSSYSHGTLQDRIQRERKAHTMAPAARISGPHATLQSKLFANINAPIDNLTQQITKSDDDDAPIIVKVRYDPSTGVKPSEEVVRKAINNQMLNRRASKDPIVMNFIGQNIQPQVPNSFSFQKPLQPSYNFSPMPPSFLHNKNIRPEQRRKPTVNHQPIQPLKLPPLPKRNINISLTNGSNSTGNNIDKLKQKKMAYQQSAYNDQQTLSQHTNSGPLSNEVFRPPPVKDIPELREENLLNMLNQIPDLQGRRFNIEYAPPTAPEGYPFPSQMDSANNAYPEPVVIDKLPTNIIQHVKSSNNPALTAALEASIQQEQHFQSTNPSLYAPPPTVVHHAAQPYQQVQKSPPASSSDSDNTSEDSSSETSSSEDNDSTETKGVPLTKSANNIPFVGPMPPKYC